MVRAILEDRKAQTRQALNRNKLYNGFAFDDPRIARACPYGQPGDRLWVRETFYVNAAGEIIYRADFEPGSFAHDSKGWRPSIFMPRTHSRIDLEVMSVKVEQVQTITPRDAGEEGIIGYMDGSTGVRVVGRFAVLWDSINAKRGYGWAENPYVWAITFKRRV